MDINGRFHLALLAVSILTVTCNKSVVSEFWPGKGDLAFA